MPRDDDLATREIDTNDLMEANQRHAPKMGRPSKLTDKFQKDLTDLIIAGNYSEIAAQYLGIAKGTFHNWMALGRERKGKRYADFHDAVKRAEAARENRLVLIMSEVVGKVRADPRLWTAAMTMLERTAKDRWNPRIGALEVSGTIKHQHEVKRAPDAEHEQRLSEIVVILGRTDSLPLARGPLALGEGPGTTDDQMVRTLADAEAAGLLTPEPDSGSAVRGERGGREE